jgi:hypothetical protein
MDCLDWTGPNQHPRVRWGNCQRPPPPTIARRVLYSFCCGVAHQLKPLTINQSQVVSIGEYFHSPETVSFISGYSSCSWLNYPILIQYLLQVTTYCFVPSPHVPTSPGIICPQPAHRVFSIILLKTACCNSVLDLLIVHVS